MPSIFAGYSTRSSIFVAVFSVTLLVSFCIVIIVLSTLVFSPLVLSLLVLSPLILSPLVLSPLVTRQSRLDYSVSQYECTRMGYF